MSEQNTQRAEPVAWYMHLWNEADEDVKSEIRWGQPSVDDIERAEHNGHDIEHLYAGSAPAAPAMTEQNKQSDTPAPETHMRGALDRLLDACIREFGWQPDAPSEEPAGDDPDCEITWGDLHAAHLALGEKAYDPTKQPYDEPFRHVDRNPAPETNVEGSKFGKLFPTKTPDEVDRDPAYRAVHRELATMREAILRTPEQHSVPEHDEVSRAKCRLAQQLSRIPTKSISQHDRDIQTLMDACGPPPPKTRAAVPMSETTPVSETDGAAISERVER